MKLLTAIQKFNGLRQFKVKPTTVSGYDFDLRNFSVYLRNPEIEQVEFDDVINYLKILEEHGWQRNTFIRKCTAFHKFFYFCKGMNMQLLFDPDLIPIPEKEYNMPRVATEELYQRLVSTIPQNNDPRHIRNRAIIMLLHDTGMRNGEACSLNIADIDTQLMTATVKTEKAKSRMPFRNVYWTEKTNIAIKAWIAKRQSLLKNMLGADIQALFFCISGPLAGRRFGIKGVGEILRRYSNKAGIPYVNAHSLRHKFGRDAALADLNNSTISGLMGHSSMESSYIYTLLNPRQNQEVHRKFRK